MKCIVCGNDKFELIHHGTRDIKNVDVYKCMCCGGNQLSSFDHITQGFYEHSGMYQNNNIKNLSNEAAITDDLRRITMFAQDFMGKTLLDFGCGQGGFLRLAQNYAQKVYGVELEETSRNLLNKDGIKTESDINQFSQKFDVITMFHVIEHLTQPYEFLKLIREKLDDNGQLIIETPNANDVLISRYNCEAFKNFTYWGCHVFLYTSYSLELLLKQAGFKINWSKQIQRFPISNHLYWLSKEKPGGHNIWKDMNLEELNHAYARVLEKNNMCDTLLLSVSK